MTTQNYWFVDGLGLSFKSICDVRTFVCTYVLRNGKVKFTTIKLL